MTTKTDSAPDEFIAVDRLPTALFAECELDDPKPSAAWEPSPDQIRRWSEQIRDEREELRRDSG